MASERRRISNIQNAARSTGPRTADGKARSAQNSRRHGFASSIANRGHPSPETERLARTIAGKNPDFSRLEYAYVVAEMQVLLSRISAARIKVINDFLVDKSNLPATVREQEEREGCIGACRIQKEDDSARKASNELEAAALLHCITELRRLDRYEAHAVSRRTRVIRLING